MRSYGLERPMGIGIEITPVYLLAVDRRQRTAANLFGRL